MISDAQLNKVALLALDVDGVLTDGKLYFSADGDHLKAFNSQDGHGIKMLSRCGVQIAIITGRTSDIVARRAAELGVNHLIQGREDKLVALQDIVRENTMDLSQVAYIGDDLPDLAAIMAAGVGVTVANAVPPLAEHADYVTRANGGNGAVREVCDMILKAKGYWNDLVDDYRFTKGLTDD